MERMNIGTQLHFSVTSVAALDTVTDRTDRFHHSNQAENSAPSMDVLIC